MVLSDLDRDLLNRCLAGSDGAWDTFIDRYLALLTHVVTATAKARFHELPAEIRDDMIAEILLALVDDDFAILRRFRGQSSLGTYLVVVARRIAARRLTKLPQTSPHFGNGELVANPATEDEHRDFENVEEVKMLLDQLPEIDATAIRMFHLEHCTYADIAARLNMPENSVGPLLSKARTAMKSLAQRGRISH